MKKIALAVCVLGSMAVLAACQPSDPAVSSSQATSSVASVPVESKPPVVRSEASSNTSSSPWGPDDYSDGYAYKMKRVPFLVKKDGSSYQVNYLQILGDKPQSYSKVNLLLKERAMRNADVFGFRPYYDEAAKKDLPVDLITDYEVAYRNDQFISVIIRTEYKVGDAAKRTDFDTINCYLDESGSMEQCEITMQGILNVNDSLAEVLLQAVKDQATQAVQDYLTLDRIKLSLYENPMFFKDIYMAFSLPLPTELGGHVEIKLNYPELAPFMKASTVWQNFI